MYSRAEGIAEPYWPWPVFCCNLQQIKKNFLEGFFKWASLYYSIQLVNVLKGYKKSLNCSHPSKEIIKKAGGTIPSLLLGQKEKKVTMDRRTDGQTDVVTCTVTVHCVHVERLKIDA